MQAIIRLLILISVVGVTFSGPIMAQQGMTMRGGGGWGVESPYGRMYSSQTIETIKGEVITIDTMTPMRGMNQGVHLMVKTNNETISVHLGPVWYIENQDISIAAKDQVEIKGSRITLDGESVLIAAEIKKGVDILKLRDTKGFPVWSGWRRR